MKKFYQLLADELVGVVGAAYYNTEYDMRNACPKCGTGAILIGPRYMSGLGNVKKRLFFAGYGELLADEKLADRLAPIGIENLAEVYSSKGKKMPFMEIKGEEVIPRFSDLTTGYAIEGQCDFCKRDGYFNRVHTPLKLVYENIDEKILQKDILITYERFGLSRLRTPFKESVFAGPYFIISDKVKNFLEEEKVKGLEFEPVTILSTAS
jgi:hypothetical protein